MNFPRQPEIRIRSGGGQKSNIFCAICHCVVVIVDRTMILKSGFVKVLRASRRSELFGGRGAENLYVPVPEVSLQRPRVVAPIGQRIAAGVPEHVRVRR